jgi:ankyrin repeat protein
VPVVEWLLQNGADATAKTAKSQTPLHIVISRSHDFGIPKTHKVIRLLLPSLSHKPALNFEDENGMTALDLAKEQNLTGIIQQLMQQGATENPHIEVINKRFYPA